MIKVKWLAESEERILYQRWSNKRKKNEEVVFIDPQNLQLISGLNYGRRAPKINGLL